MNKPKRTKPQPQSFIRFLKKTGEGSLKAKFSLPQRARLQRAVDNLDHSTSAVIDAIERLQWDHERKHVLHALWSALACAYMIGSEGTISDNTIAFAANDRAAKMRDAKSRKSEPYNKRIEQAIAEAQKRFPPGRRGRTKAVDSYVAEK